ncbi:D-alanyl-lipoteichoic acid biosynthesis protein DltD [Oscillospiraceae bacterium OttesenSCG-928-F05]|nr:D-alanyl-lipoteichoic acid biosynthesis protein DltD [Oscillospiraceae bacterium OttesenSCG-928-F05]
MPDASTKKAFSGEEEYKDLNFLLEVCALKGIEPLFVHVPLHGQWSDFTGFTSERREEYYERVRTSVKGAGFELFDLTPYEYESYVLCDVMHLGWRGWLYVDKALVDYMGGG